MAARSRNDSTSGSSEGENGSATIREVAVEAGVSVSTVSLAMNGAPGVAPATRERVLAAARSLSYRPNQAARSLRSARTQTLGVVIPSLRSPVYEGFLRGAAHEARRQGYALFICDAEYDAELYRGHLARLFELRVDGLVIGQVVRAPELLRPFIDSGTPIDPPEAGDPDAAAEISARGETVYRQAYDHMLGLGHQRIAYVRLRRPGVELDPVGSGSLLAWLRDAVNSIGLPEDALEVLELDAEEDTEAAVAALLSGPNRPTALVVVAELLLKTLLAIAEVGYEIPRDLSLLSVGDASWAAAFRPPIATVGRDSYARGRAAVQRVVRSLAQDSAAPAETAAPPLHLFMPRGSLAAPPWVTSRRP